MGPERLTVVITLMKLALIALVALAGCAPSLAQYNDAGGVVNQTGSVGNDRAFALAEAHCAKTGKVAVITRTSDALNRRMSFECRAK